MKKTISKKQYHHGDLHQKLLDVATQMIEKSGIESISLRKLAARVGVSRTAPYHHFKDKNDLLCAIAEKAYKNRFQLTENYFQESTQEQKEQFREFVYGYVQFANESPELYELMFGRAIWKQQKSTKALKDAAYPCFQQQLELITNWQNSGLLNKNENTLRLTQVVWRTMHGIAKLQIDGIYIHTSQIEEMCDCAINLFTS